MSNESSEEIFAEMRKMPLDVFIDANANPVFKSYADRLEAAKRREDEKHSEEVQSLQRTIKKLNDALAEQSATPFNIAAARVALEAIINMATCTGGDLGNPIIRALLEQLDKIRAMAQAALEEPYRNCDMFGGDFKMLHTAWYDWTGSSRGSNPDGTVKLTFGEWLLVMAMKGVRK